MRLLFMCLDALFMSHEQCTRYWLKKRKEKKKAEMHLRENANAIQTPSKKVLVQLL